jgi:tetratricopeptide (TPR) repeat protein
MNSRIGVLAAALIGFATMSGTGWSQSATALSTTNAIPAQKSSVDWQPSDSDGEGWFKLARLYQDRARYDDAERAFGKAIELLKSGDRGMLADAEDCMGTMYVEMGRYAQAEVLVREALAFREKEKDPVGMGMSRMHLAMLSLGKRNLADAATDAEAAVDLLVSR